jgi:hypothetical protein
MGARGGDESAFKLPSSWEGPVGKAKVANRTREIRLCGMTRGACGNVDQGGTRHPPCTSKEQGLATLHLKLCAPQFYPDWVRFGECAGHHRGLRAGHVFLGGTRALGRATGLLDVIPGLGDRVTKGPGAVWALRPGNEPSRDTTNHGSRQGIGEASDKRSAPRRAVWQS